MTRIISFILTYIAEALIAWLYFDYIYERRRKAYLAVLTYLAGYGVLFGLQYIGSVIVNIGAFFAVTALLSLFGHRCKVKTAIFHSAFLTFIMAGSEILCDLIISRFGHGFADYQTNDSVMIALMASSKLLYLLLSLIGARIFSPHKRHREEPKMMILFCALPLLSSILAFVLIQTASRMELNASSGLMIVLTVFSLLIVNLLFLVLYNYIQHANEEYLALQLSLQKEEADTAYYQALQKQADSQRILIHDMKNHLSVMVGLLESGNIEELKEYLAGLQKDPALTQKARKCSDPILNMILLRFAEECENKGIAFQCDVRENTVSFMDAPSITTLYGNLLSNALDAAEQSRAHYVELSSIPSQDSIILSVINSCDEPPTRDENGTLLTTKAEPSLHGYGLKAISRIVRRYRGDSLMRYDSELKKFSIVIRFPFH